MGRRGSPAGAWRRASADFGQLSVSAEDSSEFAVMPCDGRECKIRIVERLGEISGSRANSAASEGDNTDSVTGSSGGVCASGELNGACVKDCSSWSRDSVQQTSLARDGSMSSTSGLGGGDLDDMALNELGDTELEGLLEEMWMKVMGQVRISGWKRDHPTLGYLHIFR